MASARNYITCRDATAAVKNLKSLESRLPEYRSREMKKHFQRKYSNVASTWWYSTHIIRDIYSESTDQNPTLDNRMRNAILSDDP